MLVICVRRKYVTLIYDLPGRGGVFTRAGGGVYPGGGRGYYKFCLESRKIRMFLKI